MNTLIGIAGEDEVAPLFISGTCIAQQKPNKGVTLDTLATRILVVDEPPERGE